MRRIRLRSSSLAIPYALDKMTTNLFFAELVFLLFDDLHKITTSVVDGKILVRFLTSNIVP